MQNLGFLAKSNRKLQMAFFVKKILFYISFFVLLAKQLIYEATFYTFFALMHWPGKCAVGNLSSDV